MKGFALGLALKQRPKATRKSRIQRGKPDPGGMPSFYTDVHFNNTLNFSINPRDLTDCSIAISTYSMVSHTGKRSWEAEQVGSRDMTRDVTLLLVQ